MRAFAFLPLLGGARGGLELSFFLPFLVVFRQEARLKVVPNKNEDGNQSIRAAVCPTRQGAEKHDLYGLLYVLQGRSNPRTWVYRVSLNTCISADRKKKRRKTIPLSMDINLFEDNDADSRRVQMLRNRIARLGPFDRAIVLLWLENMSYEENSSTT
jgi:hypothetical protein